MFNKAFVCKGASPALSLRSAAMLKAPAEPASTQLVTPVRQATGVGSTPQ
jgi:hypothetical protein